MFLCASVQAARLAGLERQYNKDLKEMLDEAARWAAAAAAGTAVSLSCVLCDARGNACEHECQRYRYQHV
jgi:ribosomal protein L12E/L44/L45/RPP1/RPP2